MAKTVEELLLDIFGGNPYFAKARVRGEDITYEPVEVPLSLDLLREHLEGKERLGAYQLLQGSNVVRWMGWDVDSKDLAVSREQAQRIINRLGDVPHAVEFSGRKGYHILIFLKDPIMAEKAKKIVDWIRNAEGLQSTGDSHVECFPKQERLTKSRPKGNLLKIPLGEHPRTHDRSRFIDPLNGWENGPALEPLDILQFKATLDDIDCIMSSGPAPEEQLIKLMSDNWQDGKRHDLALYLSGFLAHEGWTVEKAKDLMDKICKAVSDDEIFNRLQTVETTFIRHREGKAVRGRQGLGEMLPVTIMQKLTELVSFMRVPDSVMQIDEIRYCKQRSVLENVRLASNTIWSFLNDDGGRVFQTEDRVSYWYDHETHTVTAETSEMWKAILNKKFGLNPVDGFSKLVLSELHLRVIREAPFVPIYRSSFWDQDAYKLYISMGGPEVYVVDGSGKVDKVYNGECGYMFLTNDSGKYIIPDFEVDPINSWKYLVEDINFKRSVDAPAKPEEQKELLKAWILAFFFQELMPTKPILAMLGAPGSGKTTSIRRILRIVEDPDGDVLGLNTDKQDSIRASIAGHRLLVLDNLEKSGVGWLVDILNKLATGSNIELRQLYKTNEKYIIIPRCFVACTAVSMPFSDETLFSRLLVLEMEQLQEPQPEHILQRRIKEFGPAIWADLLRILDKVVLALKEHETVRQPTNSRLADFTMFCERIKSVEGMNADKLALGLKSMINSQLRQLQESSQAITLLEEWLNSKPLEASQWHNFQQLYNILSTMSLQKRQEFNWKSSTALERHMLTLSETLKRDFLCEIKDPSNGIKGAKLLRFKTGEGTADQQSDDPVLSVYYDGSTIDLERSNGNGSYHNSLQ